MSLSDYKRLQQIGSGAFGDAILVALKSDEKKKFVLKEMTFNSSDEKKDCEAEVDMLRHLKHPHIVAFHESFNKGKTVYLVMEYCSGGDLGQYLKGQSNHLSEQRIISWTLQILQALKYLHGRPKPVLHRDMKPANVFLTENCVVKIGDFGVSRELKHVRDLATTICGTPLYLAPEIFRQEPYDHTCDIWSLGCCVYEMMTLKTAINPLLLAMLNIVSINPMPNNYSKDVVDIVQQMLSIDATDRPSAAQCIDLLTTRPDSPSPRSRSAAASVPSSASASVGMGRTLPVDSLILYGVKPQPGQPSSDEDDYDCVNEIEETLTSEPVPIKTAAWFLRTYGYKFNDNGQLVDTTTGGRFKFDVSPNKKENEERYQGIARAVTEYVYELLEKEVGMYRIHLPLDYEAGEPWTFVFVTPDIFSNPDKLLILIGGAGPIRAGLWSRKAVINESIDAGSQISLIREASRQGYAVLLLNQNQTYIEVDRCKVAVRGNRNEIEHTLYVWDNLILKNTKAKHIAIMTHSEGADIAAKLAIERKESFMEQVFGVAVCHPRRSDFLQGAPKEVVDLFTTHSRVWVASKEPLDKPLKKSGLATFLSKEKSNVEHSAGDVRPEWTAFTSMNSAIDFLKKQYELRKAG